MPFVPLVPQTPNPLPIPRVGLPGVGESGMLFTPLPDITPYELALCTTLLCAAASQRGHLSAIAQAWEALPDSAKRHWQPGH